MYNLFSDDESDCINLTIVNNTVFN